MNIIQTLATSPRFYPLWRIGWLERLFFRLCRRFLIQATTKLFDLTRCGLDVSKWQGVVNFEKMFAYGTQFLILRAGYGIKQDERFAEYMQTAPLYFPISVYHYYDPQANPLEQAYKLLGILEPYTVRRVWLDLEFTWDGTYKDPKYWKAYRDVIKAAGYRVGWYTRKTWWDSRVSTYAAEFAKDPAWVAQYSSALTLIPAGWASAYIWQSGTPAIGAQVGVSSAEVDFDVWNTDLDFDQEWDGAPTPPAGGTVEETHKGTVKRDLNVRSGPPMNGVLAPLTGKVLHAGDIVYGQLDKVTDWFNFGRVTRIDGSAGAFAGWASAVDWDTANPPYIAVTAIAPPPPPDTLDINVDVVVNVEGYLPKTISISGSLEKA